jgi:hypothetical protein
MLARLLQKAAGNKRDGTPRLSFEDAVFAVMYSMGTGMVPFRDFYITDAGIIEGYKGLLKQAARYGEVSYRFRKLTDDERQFHDVGADDLATACELFMNGKHVATGYGFVRRSERYETGGKEPQSRESQSREPQSREPQPREPRLREPRYGSWGRIAENRALKDALRHAPMPGPGEGQAAVAMHNLLVNEARALESEEAWRALPPAEVEARAERVRTHNPLRPRRNHPDLAPPPSYPGSISAPIVAAHSDEDDDDGPLTDEDVSVVQVPPPAPPPSTTTATVTPIAAVASAPTTTALPATPATADASDASDDDVIAKYTLMMDIVNTTPSRRSIRDKAKWTEHLAAKLAEYGIDLATVSDLVFDCSPEELNEADLQLLVGFFFVEQGNTMTINEQNISRVKEVLS